MDANRTWAKDSFAVCRKMFGRDGNDNTFAEFDTGTVRMSLAYQARKMELYTHAMGEGDHVAIAKYLDLGEDEKVICGIAVGVAAPRSTLDSDIADEDKPTALKPLSGVLKRL